MSPELGVSAGGRDLTERGVAGTAVVSVLVNINNRLGGGGRVRGSGGVRDAGAGEGGG